MSDLKIKAGVPVPASNNNNGNGRARDDEPKLNKQHFILYCLECKQRFMYYYETTLPVKNELQTVPGLCHECNQNMVYQEVKQ